MFHLIQKGGVIMWPLMILSIVATATVIERLFFIIREKQSHRPEEVETILGLAEKGKINEAISLGQASPDFVARTLAEGLAHRDISFSAAVIKASNKELQRFSWGLTILDTAITLAPLLGLLGTVTGMIGAFGLLGNKELEAPSVITGGIAEALIATAFGLGIAIVSLIPFNYLNSKLEDARRQIEDASTHLELLLIKSKGKS